MESNLCLNSGSSSSVFMLIGDAKKIPFWQKHPSDTSICKWGLKPKKSPNICN